MKYDIIGDIHGHADKLERLLCKLGYSVVDGVYGQQGHSAVFVGDLIDRGVQNHRVIEIVQNMVKNGRAYAVMGNHEYNAICYHTNKNEKEYLRAHNSKNHHQHENFLYEYPLGNDNTNEVINWFKTLPLFLDFSEFRVVHACWDQQAINDLLPYVNTDCSLKQQYLVESATKGAKLYEIIERLLKGVEVDLPQDIASFADKDGVERRRIRVKWWEGSKRSYRDLAIGYDKEVIARLPGSLYPNIEDIPIYDNEKPVFFGHYWMTGEPTCVDKTCCVDYSAGKGEKLVAYKFVPDSDKHSFDWV